MKLSDSNINKFLFIQKKAFFIFRDKEVPKKFLILQETKTLNECIIFREILSSTLKNFLYFRKDLAKIEK